LKKILIVLLLCLLPTPFIFFWVRSHLAREIGVDTIIFVKKNSGLNQVIADLRSVGIIKRPSLFRFVIGRAMKNRGKKHLRYGEYLLESTDSLSSVIDKLVNNRIFYRSITFPEGLSNKSIFKLLEKNEFLSGEITGRENIVEGSLLADTYYFKREDSRDSILERMQRDMAEFVDSHWNGRDEEYSVKTKEDLLILASIVEKESGSSAEKKLIASVFLNRLGKKMRLQSDPTAIYAYTQGDVEKEKELKTSALIKIDSPFNTYRSRGLPPTPICNPGRESILAVLQPSRSDYLFFVINDKGGHSFSTNYGDHLKFIGSLKINRRQARKIRRLGLN
jgi:UPF0755 protein